MGEPAPKTPILWNPWYRSYHFGGWFDQASTSCTNALRVHAPRSEAPRPFDAIPPSHRGIRRWLVVRRSIAAST